jgi:hypothetical protein
MHLPCKALTIHLYTYKRPSPLLQTTRPNSSISYHTIFNIEFTFTHDQYLEHAIQTKIDKYNPLIEAIKAQGWQVAPYIVITVGERGAIQ